MAKQRIGKVVALWRYPVKSMLGEPLTESSVVFHGLAGDRAWALREMKTGRIVSAKKFPKMFEMRAAYERVPETGEAVSIRIELPDGRTIHAEDADASAVLSAVLGCEVRLERPQPEQAETAGMDPATIFGDVSIDKIFPGMTPGKGPDFFLLGMKGTFFDSAAIHVLASATLDHMRRLAGGASRFDPRRFRPNIFVESANGADAFVEDEWLGGMLEVGEAVKITGMQPALRCVMTTHRQGDLERDPAILRTAAQHHKANVGVFASIGAPGTIRIGDPVYLVK